MPAPVVGPAAARVYSKLPEGIRAEDADHGYAALLLAAACATGLEEAVELLTLTNPETSASGTNELVNADLTPRKWLAWRGWIIGIDTGAIPVAFTRQVIGEATDAQRHGSRAAIAAVVARTLSSTTPWPRVWANLSGSDPSLITVVTTISQTPDEIAALSAAWSEKPLGSLLDLQVFNGAVIVELEMAFTGQTIADLEATFASIVDLEAWMPTT